MQAIKVSLDLILTYPGILIPLKLSKRPKLTVLNLLQLSFRLMHDMKTLKVESYPPFSAETHQWCSPSIPLRYAQLGIAGRF